MGFTEIYSQQTGWVTNRVASEHTLVYNKNRYEALNPIPFFNILPLVCYGGRQGEADELNCNPYRADGSTKKLVGQILSIVWQISKNGRAAYSKIFKNW